MDQLDKLCMGIYNDYYGALLTKHQSELVRKYYDFDMSLAEIGKEVGISPQGVRDTLQRAEKLLKGYEEKLGLVRKTIKMKELLEEFEEVATPEQKIRIKEALEILED